MILPARCYIGYSRQDFETRYQHFDAYFDQIWYKKLSFYIEK